MKTHHRHRYITENRDYCRVRETFLMRVVSLVPTENFAAIDLEYIQLVLGFLLGVASMNELSLFSNGRFVCILLARAMECYEHRYT